MSIEINITIELTEEKNLRKNAAAQFARKTKSELDAERWERQRQKAERRRQRQQKRQNVERKLNEPTKSQSPPRRKYMPGYYDSEGNAYELKERLGSGGEGTVYACADSKLVAKIYHEPVTDEKAEKLCWMAAHKNEQLLKVAAWVVDVLRAAPDGKVVGFLMPSVRAKEIHELYSLKSRRVYFSEATWYFLIHTAANVARAFYNLHKNAHIMGDVNHGNCVVLADGTVKLIDCDSYSIKTDKMRYPCEVGVATHLAPELHGLNLSKVERLAKHDNFGMAVIIFQLLFLGRHPFAGNYLGAEDKSIEDCIREYRFAYGANAKLKNVRQPPGTLPLEAVSPRVALMLERAFLTEDRPAPREWIEALEDLSDNLEQCADHPGHVFFNQLKICPWCELELQTGVMLFPFVMSGINQKNNEERKFDITTVEKLITGFETHGNLEDGLRVSNLPVTGETPPAPEIVGEHLRQRNLQLIIISIYFIMYFALAMLDGMCAFMIGVVATIVIQAVYGNTGRSIRLDARERLAKMREKWHKVENDWKYLVGSSNLNQNLARLKQRVVIYHEFVKKSVEWSSEATEFEQSEYRQNLEREIGNLLAALRVSSIRVTKHQRLIQTQAQPLIHELAQAESNAKFLGASIPIAVALGLITILIPLLGFLISSGLKSNVSPEIANRAVNTIAAPTKNAPKMNVFVPEENITDREIEKIPFPECQDIVAELIRLGDLAVGNKDAASAEKKLNFALRFDARNMTLLNRLGTFYYGQGDYKKALNYLNRSKTLGASDDADFYTGMIDLQLKNYVEARDIFLKLTTGGMQNNASFYNLGLAQQALKNYPSAIAAFEKALSFEPNDIDSTYQMGICFSKTGDAEQVRNFYRALLEKDAKRAAQFKKAVGKSVNLDSYYVVSSDNAPVAVGNGVGSGAGN